MSEQGAGSSRLDGAAYRRVLRAGITERQRIVVRLAGEAGLRPSEIADLAVADVESREHGGATHFLVRLDASDGGRLVYLPADLVEALRSYVDSTGRHPDEPIVGVSPRRIQMIVREAVEQAAAELGDPSLEDVSTRELRRYHARALFDRGTNPRVVRATTAWNRLETLAASFAAPDEEAILESLQGVEFAGPSGSDSGRESNTADRGDGGLVELVDCVVDLGDTLSRASTREAIEREACDALATFYDYALMASEAGNDELGVRARSIDDGADVIEAEDAPPRTAAMEVYETGEPTVETGDPFADGGAREPRLRAIVPVVHADTTYGVLEVGVRADGRDVDDVEQRVLRDLGRRLGQSIAAVERRRLLLADTVLRLSFGYTDRGALFVWLSDVFDCSFSLTGLVPGEDGSLLAFVWLEGASPEDVFRRATDAASVESARLIRSSDDGALLEFVVTADSPALTLVECGGSLTELTATEGRGTVTAEFVPDVDVREVAEAVEADFPDSELVAKREVDRSVRTDTEFKQALEDTLTDKQRSTMRAAYLSGYFDWPRGSTAEELADSLGVSSPTFHNHLRRAQRKILATFLEDGEP